MGGLKHKVEEGKHLLMKELKEIIHHMQSGKAKLTPQSASALANIVQSLEITRIFEEIEEMGGLKHVLESVLGGGGHGGGHRQIGFAAPYGQHSRMPDHRWQPQMIHDDLEMARRRRYRRPRYDMDMPHGDMDADMRYDLESDMDADLDIHDDMDRYDMEMARRYRRNPRRYTVRRHTRRVPRYETDGDMADDMRADTHNALVSALEAVTRYANPTHRADGTHSRNDMRYDGTSADMRADNPTVDTRTDGQPTHRVR